MLLTLLEGSQKFPSSYITQQCMRSKVFISFINTKEIAHVQTHDVSSMHYSLIKQVHDTDHVICGIIMNLN